MIQVVYLVGRALVLKIQFKYRRFSLLIFSKTFYSCSLIDICCGTGSIGLSLADRCGQVLGIDILEEAINDANKNALANNITNCEFMIGSVEESLQSLWRRVAFTEAICVIDPPRSGVGPKAVQSIRKNTSIAKIIYVARYVHR